ncbi:MAG: type II toxin-antitoxin system RelE/ParE family toxin [Candidatus Symbiobacter sp.]|nr:type II toxin-antitoxin system RelE/ParE family toxin [Candidatus Symbiobacter sp.]
MGNYRISLRADHDLANIYAQSLTQFGIEQARHYRQELFRIFDLIASFPRMGRKIASNRLNLRTHTIRSHVVYYREEKDGILIVRVLHGAMNRP